MIHLVTFASDDMKVSAGRCVSSGMDYGCKTAAIFDPIAADDRDTRGLGFWAWKPRIISWAMEGCSDGELLIYSDAGVEFINNVSHIIDRMDQDIFLFGNNWEHAHWCKREIIDRLWPLQMDYDYWSDGLTDDEIAALDWARFGKQVQASIIFFRVSDYTRAFVKEWLDWCLFEGGRLIDDSPSRTPNHPEFQENRHDQAILTTMAYRDGLKLHWWPAIYNDGQFTYEKLPVYASDNYPPIFHHHRRRNHEWSNAA